MKNTIKCQKCKGAGAIENPAYVGQFFRKRREAKDIGLRELARRMKISPAYLSELEHGKRRWSKKLKNSFMENI